MKIPLSAPPKVPIFATRKDKKFNFNYRRLDYEKDDDSGNDDGHDHLGHSHEL